MFPINTLHGGYCHQLLHLEDNCIRNGSDKIIRDGNQLSAGVYSLISSVS